jgi:hypothetical protein
LQRRLRRRWRRLNRRCRFIEDGKLVVVVRADFPNHQRLEDGTNLAKYRQGGFMEDAWAKVVVKVIAEPFHKGAVVKAS